MVIDLLFGLLLAIAVFAGWKGGLIGRLGSWVGFAVAALAAARWVTAILDALNVVGKHQRLAAAAAAVAPASDPAKRGGRASEPRQDKTSGRGERRRVL